MRALLIPADGKPTISDIPEGLTALQTAVGGYIEPVDLRPDVVLYLDEEGKLRDKPHNEYATRLTRGILRWNDLVVGDCVAVGFDAETGKTKDLPDDFTW